MNDIKKQIRQKQDKLNALKKQCAKLRAEIDALHKQLSAERQAKKKAERRVGALSALHEIYKSGKSVGQAASEFGWSVSRLRAILEQRCKEAFPDLGLCRHEMLEALGSKSANYLRYLFDDNYSKKFDEWVAENFPKRPGESQDARMMRLFFSRQKVPRFQG